MTLRPWILPAIVVGAVAVAIIAVRRGRKLNYAADDDEAVILEDSEYKLTRKHSGDEGSGIYLYYNDEVIASGDFDRNADAFFINIGDERHFEWPQEIIDAAKNTDLEVLRKELKRSQEMLAKWESDYSAPHSNSEWEFEDMDAEVLQIEQGIPDDRDCWISGDNMEGLTDDTIEVLLRWWITADEDLWETHMSYVDIIDKSENGFQLLDNELIIPLLQQGLMAIPYAELEIDEIPDQEQRELVQERFKECGPEEGIKSFSKEFKLSAPADYKTVKYPIGAVIMEKYDEDEEEFTVLKYAFSDEEYLYGITAEKDFGQETVEKAVDIVNKIFKKYKDEIIPLANQVEANQAVADSVSNQITEYIESINPDDSEYWDGLSRVSLSNAVELESIKTFSKEFKL